LLNFGCSNAAMRKLTRSAVQAIVPALVAAALLVPAAGEEHKAGVTTERVVVDSMTGFAIGGYDAVAYFERGTAVEGRDGFEATWDGAIWRFANAGDRDAFLDAPDLYAPQYGGHCAMSAAEGVPAEGDPRIFAVAGGRLYFFRGEAERQEWLASPGQLIAAAEAKWPQVREMLAE
jgi:hypothetical protein